MYDGYKAVKANAGAAGVDKQTLEEFDKDPMRNLYKIWNRMSSGCYFPPPVRAVAIPKWGAARLSETSGCGRIDRNRRYRDGNR